MSDTAEGKCNFMATETAPWIMGINASHNGAVCLLKGDRIVVAIQEERLTRKKRMNISGAHRCLSIEYCLAYAGIKPGDLSLVVMSVAGEPAISPLHDLKINPLLEVELNKIPTEVIPHHLAHAYSAFATSGFEEAASLVIDGCGSIYQDMADDERSVILGGGGPGFYEFISLYSTDGVRVEPLEKHASQLSMPFKIDKPGMPGFGTLGGMFQSSAAQIFGDWMDAGKVMGLAPYGRPLIPTNDFFEIADGRFNFLHRVPDRFPHNDRWPLRRREYENLACSTQAALEDALLYLVDRLYELCPSDNLCYSGGVALNSVANERIIRESRFKNVFIIPAAEDSGAAIGAAYYGLWRTTGRNTPRRMAHDAVGRDYSRTEILRAVAEAPGVEALETEGDYLSETIELLCAGKSVGWFQGRSELGPRALGQRSILCDPRRPDAKEVLNARVKHREAFRPFAPAVLLEDSAEWFDWGSAAKESPYMLRVAKFHQEKCGQVPAVVHVDGTGRVQTLTREANGPFYDLVARFKEKTGVGVLLNTSFNVMGMPIVETPADALYCLQITGLDYCVLGDVIVRKREKLFLGLDLTPDEQAQPTVARQVNEQGDPNAPGRTLHSLKQIDRPASRSLKDYVGTYGHGLDPNSITLEIDGPRLRVKAQGMTTMLEPGAGDSFVVTGPVFANVAVAFYSNERDEVAALRVLMPTGEDGGEFVLFERYDMRAMKDEELKLVVGIYECRGETLRVNLREGKTLTLIAPDGREYVLLLERDDSFSLKNTPGYNIRFDIGAQRQVSAILTQPNGRFKLSKQE